MRNLLQAIVVATLVLESHLAVFVASHLTNVGWAVAFVFNHRRRPNRFRRHHRADLACIVKENAATEPLSQVAASASRAEPTVGATSVEMARTFWAAYNRRSISDLLACCEDDVRWDDYDYSEPCRGAAALERRLRLEHGHQPVHNEAAAGERAGAREVEILQIVADISRPGTVGVSLTRRFESFDDHRVSSRRGCCVMVFSERTGLVQQVDIVTEQEEKGGEAKLRLLKSVSPLFTAFGGTASLKQQKTNNGDGVVHTEPATAAERYFDAWNRRSMADAIRLFAPNVTYDDTAFPAPFEGRDKLQAHLELCAEIFPPQLAFEVDRVIASEEDRSGARVSAVMALWHAANNGQALPYTRGCSVYRVGENGLIEGGLDFVEPNGPVKPGGVRLVSRTVRFQLEQEPRRWIPAVAWLSYMYVVFFSDGILPGANALALEERTWKEVLDLSLNFFLVAPALHLPFSPVVHPMLEAVFNLLLSWAALFAGFLSDDRRDKPNLIPMVPVVVGMQFLTSAFLLPYLAVRSTEVRTSAVHRSETSPATQWIGENRLWGPALGSVGVLSILWAFLGRTDDFGSDLAERWSSFVQLLSIDRVGSSFLVDLAIFGLFQGWMVDDDLKRRGYRPGVDAPWLPVVAKYVPFFGLALYLAVRPRLPDRDEGPS
jgi:ketosteroid isomerase-like protein